MSYPNENEVGGTCNVCGLGTRYGSRHSRCGEAVMSIEAERDKLQDVLQRHGFVRCDIPACNCGSWHPRYGYPERMQEIKDALAEAGHELNNSNGNLPLNALKQLIAERDELLSERDEILQRLIDIGSICASGSDRPADEANSFERWAELLLSERDRMRPVVEAALRWSQSYLTGEDPMLEEAINAYKSQTQGPLTNRTRE